MKKTGLFLLSIILLIAVFALGARAQSQGIVTVDHNKSFEGPVTVPPLPVPDDSQAIPPLPEDVENLVAKALIEGKIFDITLALSDINGYPFPHAKIYLLVPGKLFVMLAAITIDEASLQELFEQLIIEVRWTKLDSGETKNWVNMPLLKKIIEEMLEEPNEKESGKVTT